MWCRLAWLALLAALLAGGRWSWAQSMDGQLQYWQQQQKQTSYHGSFVYERNGVFSTHEVWRQADGEGQGQERFLRLNGSRLEALRTDGRLRCMTREYHSQPWASLPEPPMALRRFDMQQMATGYQVEQIGRGRVADRAVAVLLFAPLDMHRYPLEVHFDESSGVVLQSLLLNEQGELLERFQFVNFVVGEQADESLTVAGCEPVTAADEPAQMQAPDWLAGWVPAGFAPVAERPVQRQGVSSQLFFDGLAHFSIFVAAVDDALLDMEHRQVGPTVVMSRPVEAQGQRYMVTVLGEIPVATAQRIALSVTLGDAADD